jgi:hypothetical protein
MPSTQRRLKKFMRLFFGILMILLFVIGCTASKPLTLMSTPVIYHNAAVDPFAHLDPEEKTILTSLFYATNRSPQTSPKDLPYGNGISKHLHLGRATIRMGENINDWEDLYLASILSDRPEPLILTLEDTIEMASIDPEGFEPGNGSLSPSQQSFVDAVNADLAKAKDKEIMIYVHGAKFDFFTSCALTAEIDHFAGRDFVGVAFSWPSHQNILSYVFGIDVHRAWHSTLSLRSLIGLLANHTQVEHINIICYSAGGRVTSKALFEMRQSHADLTPQALKKKFKLGAVVFVAADIPVESFLDRLPAIGDLAKQVVVTISDADDVLKAASSIMGGGQRVGSKEAEIIEEEFAIIEGLKNFEIVDLSLGQEERGFDIAGHHYWYRHPWASSDIIFLLRTDLPPHRRGLAPADLEGVWYLSPDYPERVRNAAKKELKGQW